MIWPAIRRVLAVIFGFIFAVITSMVTLFVLGARWAAGEATAFAPQNADEMSRTLNEGLGVVAFLFTVAPLLTLLPAVAAAATGEVARIRSLLYYVMAGGAAAAIMPFLTAPSEAMENITYSAQYFAIIATAGFVGGFVYWLIAGRNA
jgi:hypothetical protein